MNYYIIFVASILVQTSLFCDVRKPQPLIIDDFSRLNATRVAGIIEPTNETELASILENARARHQKISVSGVRHSQGGQAFYKNALVVSLAKLNKVLSLEGNLLTIQAGITWKEIQDYLNPLDKAVKIMQFANLFTVGGSLSVNANGIDPHVGPLIESVRSLKIMKADGSIVQTSRTENSELFFLAIGGYGLFGIIIEATIEVVTNHIYKKQVKKLSLEAYCKELPTLFKKPEICFHIGQVDLNPWGDHFFSGIRSMTYAKIDAYTLSEKELSQLKKQKRERFVAVKRVMQGALRNLPFSRYFQRDIDFIAEGDMVSRNTLMSPHVLHLQDTSTEETQLLQEYFIPIDKVLPFLTKCDLISQMYSITILSIHIRCIPKNTESFLSYAQDDCCGIIIFFTHTMASEDRRAVERWTKSLIDIAIKLKGRYYLPAQLHATTKQLQKMYPQINEFFEAKRKYDPEELFINHLYKKYAKENKY